MAKIPVDECPAGPAMDAAVAQALGYECVCHEPDNAPFDCPIHSNDPDVRFRYSTDMAVASVLMGREKLFVFWVDQEAGLRFPEYKVWVVGKWPKRNYMAFFAGETWDTEISLCLDGTIGDDEGEICAYAETAPLAISRAFLKANGVEYIEVPE